MSRDRKTLPNRVRREVLERDNFTCRDCKQRATDDNPVEVDHILPLSQGGTDHPGNLQVLCHRCNNGKGAGTPKERTMARVTTLYVMPPADADESVPDGAYKPTAKQREFRETVGISLEEGITSLVGWCNAHKARMHQMVTPREFHRWESDEGFCDWFNEALPPEMSQFERNLVDTMAERSIAERATSPDPKVAASAAGQWLSMRKGEKGTKTKAPSAHGGVLAALKARQKA